MQIFSILTYGKSRMAYRTIGNFKSKKSSKSDRLMLGGVVLQFDKAEIEVLRLCAWCKDLPVYGCKNIPKDIIDTLLFFRYIRLSRNKTGYRCTPTGFELLRTAEMEYTQDKSYRSDSDALARRYQTAEIASFFWRYGADVFSTRPPAEDQTGIFLPSFALRRNQHANILGGTKLTGFFYSKTTAFIPYYIAADNNGIYPDVEQRTFRAETLLCKRDPHIIYTGRGDIQEIIYAVSYRKDKPKKSTTVYYKDAIDKFNCPVSLIPLTSDGMRQLRILEVSDHRYRLAKNILGKGYLPPVDSYTDGRTETENIIIGIDCNIARIESAVRSGKAAKVFVLPFQAEAVQKITAGSKVQCFVLNLKDTEDFLGIGHELPEIDRKPFQTEKGKYIYAPPIGKVKKVGR